MNNNVLAILLCLILVGFLYFYLFPSPLTRSAIYNLIIPDIAKRNQSNLSLTTNSSVLSSIFQTTSLWAINVTTEPSLELACKIPRVSPWHPDFVKAVSANKIVCKTDQPTFTTLTDGQELILSFAKRTSDIPQCRYRCIIGGPDKASVIYGSWTSLISNTTHISCEFIHVECRLKDALVYTNFHSQIIVNKSKVAELEKILPNNKSTSYHDILLLVIDSTSRVNFLRMCPKSVQLLNTMYKWAALEGFNKAGLNSFPNGLPLLAGKFYGNYSKQEWREPIDYWKDRDSLVWNQFAKKGYVTLFTEDDTPANIFVYDGGGFKRKPTDHRQRPFWKACERARALCAENSPCLRDQMKHSVMLDYVRQFLTKYDKWIPKLAVYWLIRLAHDDGGMGKLSNLDDDLADFLKQNYEKLKESFLFILGDHGHRGADMRNMDLGRLQDFMPLFSISLPQSFCASHPEAWKNVQANSHILSSFYDGYVTLRDILDSQENGWDSLKSQKDWSFTGVDASGAESLLRPLTPSRTCEQIGIEQGFCTCVRDVIPLPPQDKLWGQLPPVLISHLNTVLKEYIRCAQLTLDKTIGIQILDNDVIPHSHYRVHLQAKPSNGTFEASVMKQGDGFEIDGLIIRTNRYGNQSHCANEAWIREYCYCNDLLQSS